MPFNSIEVEFLVDTFVLAIAIILFIGSLKSFWKWWVGIDGSGFHIAIIFFEESSRSFLVLLFVFISWVLISRRYSSDQSRYHLFEISYAEFYDREIVPSLRSGFSKILRERTGIRFLENASALALIFPAL